MAQILTLPNRHDNLIVRLKLYAMKIAFPLLNEKELAIDFVHSRYIGIYDDMDSKTNLIPLSGLEKNLGITLFFDAKDCKSCGTSCSGN